MKFAQRAPSGTYYLAVFDVVNDLVFDWSNNTWVAPGSAVTPGVAMTSDSFGQFLTYFADINLATICKTSTPIDLQITMFRQAGGSPALATDVARGWGYLRACCGVKVPEDLAATPFTVDITANLTTTAGTSMHLTAELLNNGKTIPLATLDSGATCSFTVTEDPNTTGGARVSQFAVSTGTVGAANSASRFECEYANPNLASNKGFTVVAQITTGGVVYTGTCKFTTY